MTRPESLIEKKEYFYITREYSKIEKERITLAAQTSIIDKNSFIDKQGRNLLILAMLSNQEKLIPILIRYGVDINQRDSDGNTPLMYAIVRKKYMSIIKLLIRAGANIDIQNNEGKTALMYATIYNTDVSYINYLINVKANRALTDQDGKNAWDYAQENSALNSSNIGKALAYENTQKYIEAIKTPRLKNADEIKYGLVDGSFIYKGNTNALTWAAQFNKSPTKPIASLVSISNKNIIDNQGNTLVHYALNNIYKKKSILKSYKAVSKLNIAMDIANYDGITPFILSLTNNIDSKVVTLLIENENVLFNKNNSNMALATAALYNTHYQVHKILFNEKLPKNILNEKNEGLLWNLSSGVNKNKPRFYRLYNKYNVSFLQNTSDEENIFFSIARHISRPAIVRIVSKTIPENSYYRMLHELNLSGQNIMHVAAQYNTSYQTVKNLLKRGDSNTLLLSQDINEKLPVHYAVKYNSQTKIIRLFVSNYKNSLLLGDDAGKNILMYAVENTNNSQAVSVVFNAVKRINKKEILTQTDFQGNTSLHYAALFSNNPKDIRKLIKKGSDINAKNNNDQTPFMLAMLNTNTPEIAAEFAKFKNLDYAAIDAKGETAFSYAAEKGKFIDNIRLLNSLQANQNHFNQDKKSIPQLLQENTLIDTFFKLIE